MPDSEKPFPWKPDIDQPGYIDTMTRKDKDIVERKLQYIFIAGMVLIICASLIGNNWIERAYPDPPTSVAENIECQ